MSLTDFTLRNLKPSEGQITYWDKGIKSFGIRVSPGGTMTWLIIVGKGRNRIKIGNYPLISLKDARDAARRILAERTLGQHKPRAHSFKDALATFEQSHLNTLRPKTAYEAKRLLWKHFLPAFKGKTLDAITAPDVTRITDKLTRSIADHATTAIGTFLNWAVGRQYLPTSPIAGLRKPPKIPPRARLITPPEVKKIWAAAEELGWPYGTVLQVAITTGQRRGQLAELRRSWIDFEAKTISFPASVMKGKKPHTIPFSHTTGRILESIPNTGDLLFPARGKTDQPINGWSKNAELLRNQLTDVPTFVIHDFRRLVASQMASLGTSIATIEKFLAHQSHSFAGIVQVYQLHSWLPEMREAVALWEKHLAALIAESESSQAARAAMRSDVHVE